MIKKNKYQEISPEYICIYNTVKVKIEIFRLGNQFI